jgi:DSF synthase
MNPRGEAGLCIPYGKPGSQYETEFEPGTATLWGYFNPPQGAPCFSVGLLKDIAAHEEAFAAQRGCVALGGERFDVAHYVVASRTPGVFSIGGDLALFAMLIQTQDRAALAAYGTLCIDNVYRRVRNYSCPTLTTLSLVQGDALGGGFEAALASDVIVAEESAQMGLPEILFNLFPGMGACSLLARRIGVRAAEELVLSGRNGLQAVLRARQLIHPVRREELEGMVALWVDAALRLSERDLRMMQRLARTQRLPGAVRPDASRGVRSGEPLFAA